jgi:hypothetical protein
VPSNDHGPVHGGDEPTASRTTVLSSSAFTSSPELEGFVDLMSSTNVELGSLLVHVERVPLSKVYELAEEARRRATCWLDLARALERRPALRGPAAR